MRTLGRFLSLAAAVRRGTARDGLPYKHTLILSSRCPTRCTFCSIWRNPQPDELTPEEWGRFFGAAPHTVWTNLSGGEIFQRADLPAILDELARRLPRLCLVTFPTTGWFPDRLIDGCERLVRRGVPRVLVTISLDGPRDLHDRLRGRQGAHEKACAAMRALREARLPRVRAYFGMTLLPENHAAADATVEAAAAAVPGVTPRDFHFNLGMESGHYYRNLGSGMRAPREALAAVERHRRRGLNPVSLLERAYQKRVRKYLETGRSPVPCSALRASVFVDSKGIVYPCSIYDRPLGSLRENGYDLGRVLRGAEALSAREAVVADRCPGCWTPCDAYPSLLTALAAPDAPPSPAPASRSPGHPSPTARST
jgi:MoaA/NifB/PqqE/SkfB family radical SAM enzyme